MNVRKVILIYSLAAIALIISWVLATRIAAWIDVFLISFSIVVIFDGLIDWEETRKWPFTLIIGSMGVVISASLLYFLSTWIFPRID